MKQQKLSRGIRARAQLILLGFGLLTLAQVVLAEPASDLPLPQGHDYFKIRGGLENCRIRFARKKRGRIVFLGGSITQMGGWCKAVMADLAKRFPQTEFDAVNAGIGSMGSTPHSFRFSRDVLNNGPVDLLFIEAAVNDESNGMTPLEMVRGMEGGCAPGPAGEPEHGYRDAAFRG